MESKGEGKKRERERERKQVSLAGRRASETLSLCVLCVFRNE